LVARSRIFLSKTESDNAMTEDLLKQLSRIEAKLDMLLKNPHKVPVYVPTIDDELAAVEARGEDLLGYLKQRAMKSARKPNKRKVQR